MSLFEAGTSVSRYTILGKLATGGMAEVYLARQSGPSGFTKVLVLKVILPHLAEDPEFLNMFHNEAKLAALLNHPNVVQIFDFGMEDKIHYMAMEYIDGINFRRIIKTMEEQGGQIPIPIAIRVICDACSALEYAHGLLGPQGNSLEIIHRDVSLENILVTYSGQVKLVDFGIAKARNLESHTSVGTLRGKYRYMAPELIRGDRLDNRVDVFSTGVVLFRALTGQMPFDGGNHAQLIDKIVNRPNPRPRDLRPDLPDELERIILKALTKDREQRYQRAAELQIDLEGYLLSTGNAVMPYHLSQFMNATFPPGTDENRERYQRLAGVASNAPGRMTHAPLPPAVPPDRTASKTPKRPVGGGGRETEVPVEVMAARVESARHSAEEFKSTVIEGSQAGASKAGPQQRIDEAGGDSPAAGAQDLDRFPPTVRELPMLKELLQGAPTVAAPAERGKEAEVRAGGDSPAGGGSVDQEFVLLDPNTVDLDKEFGPEGRRLEGGGRADVVERGPTRAADPDEIPTDEKGLRATGGARKPLDLAFTEEKTVHLVRAGLATTDDETEHDLELLDTDPEAEGVAHRGGKGAEVREERVTDRIKAIDSVPTGRLAVQELTTADLLPVGEGASQEHGDGLRSGGDGDFCEEEPTRAKTPDAAARERGEQTLPTSHVPRPPGAARRWLMPALLVLVLVGGGGALAFLVLSGVPGSGPVGHTRLDGAVRPNADVGPRPVTAARADQGASRRDGRAPEAGPATPDRSVPDLARVDSRAPARPDAGAQKPDAAVARRPDAAAARRPDAGRAAAVKLARLSITCTQPGEALVGSWSLGRLPIKEQEVKPGRLRVRVRNTSLGYSMSRVVTVGPGDHERLHFKPQTGTIRVLVRPWAKVTLDGKPLGTTPMPSVTAFEGSHVLVLENNTINKKKTLKVTVESGQEALIKVHLEE